MVVAIVLAFRVDPRKEKLEEPGGTSERFFIATEDDIEESLHDVVIDQQIGHPLEVLKVLVVGLLGSVEYLLDEDHHAIEEILVLDLGEHLLDGMLDDAPLESLVGVEPGLILGGEQLRDQGADGGVPEIAEQKLKGIIVLGEVVKDGEWVVADEEGE